MGGTPPAAHALSDQFEDIFSCLCPRELVTDRHGFGRQNVDGLAHELNGPLI